MHRVDSSSEKPAPAECLSFSPDRAAGHSVPPGDPQPVLQFGQGTASCDEVQTASGKPQIPVQSEEPDSKSGDIPAWKRILDLTCVLLSVPFWLPIVVIVGLWIKIVSSGPIFFRQERVGYKGLRFLVLKFRTMKVNVETASHESHLEQLLKANCPMTKLDAAGDPRIIRGGRVLRATGLDELPQLFNVLRGEMSLVGPRPCTPHEFQRYQAWQRARVYAQPGLTGYWQVNGKNKTTFTEMIHLDIFYAKNMSLWLDLTIMLRTPGVLFAQLRETVVGSRAKIAPEKGAGKDGASPSSQTSEQSTTAT
jgi:lipopolysaccharide/colanic/teichoic acid biosynthesis glycosyltransferase